MNENPKRRSLICPECWEDVEPSDDVCPYCAEDLVENAPLDALPQDAVDLINQDRERKMRDVLDELREEDEA